MSVTNLGQFPKDISLTDSSPTDIPRMTFPRTDISPSGHFPEYIFFVYLTFFTVGIQK